MLYTPKHRASGPVRILHRTGGRHLAGKHKRPSPLHRFLDWLDRYH